MLTLRLIDYLLSNYETDENVRQLLDTIEIWINPLANPDGTYFGSNSSVTGATRFNANGVDLNRNFRDPGQGAHPDGNPWQPETEAMMDFMTGHHFVLSANYHGGAEVMNYPWDTWSRSHPDEDWFIHISYQYADTVKKYAGSTYFSDVVPDGVTNGYDWYPVFGGRQDFTTYFAHGREITIEVSSNMMPPANTMPDYWEYNRQAMLQYIRQCTYGIHGIVRDSVTGMPITARIEILSHDADSSHIYAEAVNGDFHRLLNPGSYSLKVSYPGYKQKILESITLPDFTSSLWTEVELAPGRDIPSLLYETEQDRFTSFLYAENKLWINIPDEGSLDVVLYSAKGQMVYKTKNVNHTGGFMIVDLDENLTPGMYFGRVIRNGKYLGEIRFSCK